MEFILDIGNSRAKYFAFEKGKPIAELVEEGHSLLMIQDFIHQHLFISGIVGSVVDLDAEAESRMKELPFPLLRMSGTTPVPIKNMYHTPETLGCDRLAAAVAAWTKYPNRPILIIDAGSCITFDFIDENGNYHGGNISLGIQMRLQALADNFARLPFVEEKGTTPVLGYDTETAIRSGAIEGVRHEIEGYILNFKKQYPSLLVLLTGGSELFLQDWHNDIIFADHYMVACGLDRILAYNQQRNCYDGS